MFTKRAVRRPSICCQISLAAFMQTNIAHSLDVAPIINLHVTNDSHTSVSRIFAAYYESIHHESPKIMV